MVDSEAREDADLLKSIADQIAGHDLYPRSRLLAVQVLLKFKDEFVEKAREQAARRKEGKAAATETTLICHGRRRLADLITINIDSQDVDVQKGINIIEAVKRVGKGECHYCYHRSCPSQAIVACAGPVGMRRDRGTDEPVLDEWCAEDWLDAQTHIGCAANAAPEMHIRTNSMVQESRNGVTEFVDQSPLDCPICDQASAACRNFPQNTVAVSSFIERRTSASAPDWCRSAR